MNKQSRPVQTHSRLGRGLSSLIHTSTAPNPIDDAQLSQPTDYAADRPAAVAEPVAEPTIVEIHGTPLEVAIDRISPNPHQPRRTFAPEALAELAESIRAQGVLQPVLVVRSAGTDGDATYVLIAGERRLRAARQAGLDTIPCVVREADDRQMLEWSLIENIQRSDLNAVERAQAYRHYMDRFGLTQAEVAERTAESRASVANYLRMLDLCDSVQSMLVSGDLSFGHARALAALAGQAERQEQLARRIVAHGLSVRQTEQLVAAIRDAGADPAAAAGKDERGKPAYVLDLETQLTQTVGTRVLIHPGRGKNTGRIAIEYYSLDDFDRIAGLLGLVCED